MSTIQRPTLPILTHAQTHKRKLSDAKATSSVPARPNKRANLSPLLIFGGPNASISDPVFSRVREDDMMAPTAASDVQTSKSNSLTRSNSLASTVSITTKTLNDPTFQISYEALMDSICCIPLPPSLLALEKLQGRTLVVYKVPVAWTTHAEMKGIWARGLMGVQPAELCVLPGEEKRDGRPTCRALLVFDNEEQASLAFDSPELKASSLFPVYWKPDTNTPPTPMGDNAEARSSGSITPTEPCTPQISKFPDTRENLSGNMSFASTASTGTVVPSRNDERLLSSLSRVDSISIQAKEILGEGKLPVDSNLPAGDKTPVSHTVSLPAPPTEPEEPVDLTDLLDTRLEPYMYLDLISRRMAHYFRQAAKIPSGPEREPINKIFRAIEEEGLRFKREMRGLPTQPSNWSLYQISLGPWREHTMPRIDLPLIVNSMAPRTFGTTVQRAVLLSFSESFSSSRSSYDDEE